MLKSPVRPKQLQNIGQQSLKKRAKLLLKNKKLISLIFIGSLGLIACLSLNSLVTRDRADQTQTTSPLINLRSQNPSLRSAQLKLLADSKRSKDSAISLRDNARARYLLATDLIQKRQGKLALTYLQGLESDYPLLHPHILFKMAQAQQQNKQSKMAQRTLNYLIKSYPNSPITANALSLSDGDGDRSVVEERLIAEFPYHPLTLKLARQSLKQDPDRFELLLLLAKYSRDSDLNKIRDRLVLEYPDKLTTEDWEAIADGYWREEEHRKAADAYGYAPRTPRNLYRAARGFHRNGNLDIATRGYQRLLREYHDARETGEALIHLAKISNGDEAVVYLEKAIAKFPEVAPKAYSLKANIHERYDKNIAADKARDNLLNQHNNSSAAGEYRWKIAQELASNGNKEDAWQWMQPIIKSNLEFDFAPKAIYQTAKWATDLGQTADAKTAYEKIIQLYPQSYWAWRAAVKLGWGVGDFDQLRPLSPALDVAQAYSPLTTGSEALQELYLLGQYYDAWLLLQSEIAQHQQLTVNEQFSEGILKLELGQYSQGMQEIWDLSKGETPQELAQWKALRKQPAYWYGLFPFPYREQITKYAKQEKINPLLVLSVMRKESTFNPEIDSVVGAVGLMQIVPPTADWVAKQINLPNYSLTNPNDNIRIGTWYLEHNHHRYEDDSLLAVASYNAGTGNVSAWLNRYDLNDRDRFVEQIPFPETKDYVEGVFGNYWNYLRLYNPEMRQKVNRLVQQSSK